MTTFLRILLILTLLTSAIPASAIDRLATISALRNEGLQASRVMDHLTWLADVYGPRTTGSPAIFEASDWAMEEMKSWGLTKVHRDHFLFGMGWALERSAIRMVGPQPMQVIGYPIGWTPGTPGMVSGELIRADLLTPTNLSAWRGKLRGKIVLIQPPRDVRPIALPLTHRFTDEELRGLRENIPIGPQWRRGERSNGELATATASQSSARGLYGSQDSSSRNAWLDELIEFLKAEGVIAVFERGSDTTDRPAVAFQQLLNTQRTQRIDGGTVQTRLAENAGADAAERLLPWLVIAVEHYNRMARIVELGQRPTVELDIAVNWYPEPPQGNGFNTFGDIQGSEKPDEFVILGAHLDGLHPATAAVDNAAGVAVVMEAMRLLRSVGVRPKRTIRLALWGGEEHGLLGSRAFVTQNFGDPFAGATNSASARKVAAYLNIDNGSGRIRGLYARHNLDAIPVLERWIEPLRDLGVTTVSPMATASEISEGRMFAGSDHLYFDAVGIPALDMIQDRLDYFSRTYHSNMDFLDRASRPDLVQASVVFAVLAYQAAMDDEPLPRRAPGPALIESMDRN
ncbi:M20/M25/M40 family metallo-hydrolase [Sphingosinicella rhizophila]|uniref:Carboxypeptidase Q n=1 Tax=Sphingosinicella rhizophila TaxID=3050082 RepID=A0ABU3Q6V0_9SPHN|nr:M20/M25/M40 family metallo-hydrolase [Sphingosinicella sp. GR2756]MDT9598675.1 M20/M25/M40 family metallo-hydrolase [Sphingosinicella sp. GR2756]